MNKSKLSCQQGQSMAEALVLMLVLLVIFTAIPWLGRLNDISLQTNQASRYAAFQYARQLKQVNADEVQHQFYQQNNNRWLDRKGHSIVKPSNVFISFDNTEKLSTTMQPGSNTHHALALRKEWAIEDQGIAKFSVHVKPSYSKVKENNADEFVAKLNFFDEQIVGIRKHTAILVDAAHSVSDQAAHQRSASSKTAWSNVANKSYEVGKQVAAIGGPVDAAWSRPEPKFDWLTPWQGLLPKHHLESSGR